MRQDARDGNVPGLDQVLAEPDMVKVPDACHCCMFPVRRVGSRVGCMERVEQAGSCRVEVIGRRCLCTSLDISCCMRENVVMLS